ncbi:MAG: carboxypeptidase M32 [Synergistaceae bacterium]|jgi:carboxypeptidase Taq|nr:carboxypeptidase M32 [Synergistaceae bacterium]
MDYGAKVKTLRRVMRECRYYDSLGSLLMRDQWLELPERDMAYRQKMQGFFSGKQGELFHDKEVAQCAAFFENFDPANLATDLERGMVRYFLYLYKTRAKIPPEKLAQSSALTARAQALWREAHDKSDYALFKPVLKEMFELKTEIARSVDPNKPPMEVLADMCDEGISVETVDRLFGELRDGIVDLLGKIRSRGVDVDDACLRESFDKEELKRLVRHLAEGVGYPPERGEFYGEVLHPFSVSIGPSDARITTNYDSLQFGIFSTLHEAGHGLYSLNADADVVDHHLWGGHPGAFHESQSRFYENIVGRSREFWVHFYPRLQESFPHFKKVDLQTFYRAVNKVRPSLKRILADELTYSLHPIIRFEIEKAIFDGKTDFDRLPELWNDKYEEYLSLRPQNDREGLLQDMHWGGGYIGYFQSYTLGNLYGGQFRHAMLKTVPNVYEEIASGNFGPLNSWLTEHIHRHGRVYSPQDLLARATGETLKSGYFLDYLREKYKEIYKLPD